MALWDELGRTTREVVHDSGFAVLWEPEMQTEVRRGAASDEFVWPALPHTSHDAHMHPALLARCGRGRGVWRVQRRLFVRAHAKLPNGRQEVVGGRTVSVPWSAHTPNPVFAFLGDAFSSRERYAWSIARRPIKARARVRTGRHADADDATNWCVSASIRARTLEEEQVGDLAIAALLDENGVDRAVHFARRYYEVFLARWSTLHPLVLAARHRCGAARPSWRT